MVETFCPCIKLPVIDVTSPIKLLYPTEAIDDNAFLVIVSTREGVCSCISCSAPLRFVLLFELHLDYQLVLVLLVLLLAELLMHVVQQ
jgi:hypothetical protein